MFIFTSKFNREQLFTAAGQSVTGRDFPTDGRGMGYPMSRTRASGGFPDVRWCHVFTKSVGSGLFLPPGGIRSTESGVYFPVCERNNGEMQGNGQRRTIPYPISQDTGIPAYTAHTEREQEKCVSETGYPVAKTDYICIKAPSLQIHTGYSGETEQADLPRRFADNCRCLFFFWLFPIVYSAVVPLRQKWRPGKKDCPVFVRASSVQTSENRQRLYMP